MGDNLKTSPAQARANKKWKKENKERHNFLAARSHARGFIRNHASLEDLEELKGLIEDREKELKEQEKEEKN